jgi:putative peptide modification target (TIGR04139 family)
MKKLEGLKKDFSSFENNKMKNLQSIIGGLSADTVKSVESNCPACPGGYEADKYKDDGTYLSRVEIGC